MRRLALQARSVARQPSDHVAGRGHSGLGVRPQVNMSIMQEQLKRALIASLFFNENTFMNIFSLFTDASFSNLPLLLDIIYCTVLQLNGILFGGFHNHRIIIVQLQHID